MIFDKTNNWFICFDDDDPPEIVIYCPKQLSKKDRYTKINKTLWASNIQATIKSHQATGSRLFPPDWSGTMKPAIAAFLNINERMILDELQIKHDGASDEIPTNLCGYVAYDFKKKIEDVGIESAEIDNFERMGKWLNPFGD